MKSATATGPTSRNNRYAVSVTAGTGRIIVREPSVRRQPRLRVVCLFTIQKRVEESSIEEIGHYRVVSP
jgi:hypothetical protein